MIPKITLIGTPRQMGASFGEAYRKEIHEFAQSRLNRLKQYIKENCQTVVDESDIIKQVTALIPYHQNYNEDVWSEFCGIAEGADISHEMLMITMGYTDLR